MIWTYLILKIAYNAFYAGQVSCIYIYIYCIFIILLFIVHYYSKYNYEIFNFKFK